MAKKGNLFFLVHSLTAAEKRHFKLYAASLKSDSNYLQLFDVVDKQEEYDEQQIRKLFKGKSFLRQLHVTKIYLTELILKSLRNFHTGTSVSAELADLLRDIEILFSKELYDLCYHKIEKAEKLATTYEKHALLAEILSWKRKLQLAKSNIVKESIATLLDKEQQAAKTLETLNTYWHYTFNIFSYAGSKEDLLKSALFKNPPPYQSLQNQVLRYHILYTWHTLKGKPAMAEKTLQELIALLEKHPDRIRDDPSPYVTALGNYIGMLLNLKRWDDIPTLLQKIKKVPEIYKPGNSSRFTVRLWIRVYNVELEMYRDSRQLKKGIALVNEINNFLEKHPKAIPADYLLLFYYQFACIYFLAKNTTQALHWLNAIINTNFKDNRTDIQGYARLLNLVIHFELNNIILLRYAVHSCRRFLKKLKMLQPFESEMLSLFSKLSTTHKRQHQQLFAETYNQLFAAGNSHQHSGALDYIDMKSWLEEKMTKTRK